MKKITIFAAVALMVVFAFSALAAPGWPGDRRFDRSRQDRIHERWDHRNVYDHRSDWGFDRGQRMIVQERYIVPAVRFDGQNAPAFSLYLPNFCIQIR